MTTWPTQSNEKQTATGRTRNFDERVIVMSGFLQLLLQKLIIFSALPMSDGENSNHIVFLTLSTRKRESKTGRLGLCLERESFHGVVVSQNTITPHEH
jgi:hypothetical protein